MPVAARTLIVLAAIAFLPACAQRRPPPSPAATPVLGALAPSPRLIVGRVLAVDTGRRFAFVDLAPDAPAAALAEGGELISRTESLVETGRLRASRHVRGRTLGATLVSGSPSPGEEVVWLAP